MNRSDYMAIANIDAYNETLQLETFAIIEKMVAVQRQINGLIGYGSFIYLMTEMQQLKQQLTLLIQIEAKRTEHL